MNEGRETASNTVSRPSFFRRQSECRLQQPGQQQQINADEMDLTDQSDRRGNPASIATTLGYFNAPLEIGRGVKPCIFGLRQGSVFRGASTKELLFKEH